MNKNLILEIGTEELPHSFIPSALHQLKEKIQNTFSANCIGFESISVLATPRRLVLYAENVAETQEEKREKIYGPPQKLAYDEKGKPNDKAKGFATKYGLSVKDLKVEEIPGKGLYVLVDKKEKGKSTVDILKPLLPGLILSLQFPKSMRWGEESIRFARPIRWILALFGTKIINFSVGDIFSSNLTFGHFILSPNSCKIDEADWGKFKNLLKKADVIIDDKERKSAILKEANNKLAQNEKTEIDEQLVTKINYSVENPNAITGEFSKEFLKLPEEVLITVEEQLSLIPIRDKNGKLLPKFICISNGNVSSSDVIRKGYERVLNARLYDAKFFFEEDIKIPIKEKAKDLAGVIFHEQLGTYWDKTQRIIQLAEFLSKQLSLSEKSAETLKRSAYLCKADQLCEMVKEFPSLEGIMGGKYALIQGENKEVSLAIEDHYLPTATKNISPRTTEGRLLSLLAKIDSVVGYFAIGLQPTSSQDPYGVRRDTIGIILNLLGSPKDKKEGLHLPIIELLKQVLCLYQEKLNLPKETEILVAEIKGYMNKRFENILLEKGIRYDIVDAIISVGTDDFYDCYLRAEALEDLRKEKGFEELITPFKRAVNILKQAKEKCGIKEFETFDPSLASHPTEKQLWAKYQEMKSLMSGLLEEKKYTQILKEIRGIKTTVDKYFDDILIIDKDEKTRNNHLALLHAIHKFFSPVADFSKIAGEPTKKGG